MRHGRVVKNDAPLSAIFSAIQLKEMDRIEQNNLEGLMYYDVFSNLTFLLVPYCTQHKATNRHVNHHPSLTSRLCTTVLKGRQCVLLRPRCKVAFDGSLLHGCPARFAPKAERQQTGCVFCWSSLSCVEKFMCVYSCTDWCVCVSENGVCSQMPSNAFKCLFSSIFNIFSPHLCVRFLFFCCALPSADQLLRPPSVRRPPSPALFHTHNFVAQLSHTQLFHTQKKIFNGTWWHRRHFCVAGVALSDMDSAFVWQAWHLRHVTFAWQHLMTRHGTFWDGRCFCVAGVGTGLALVAGLVAGTVFCVAGVALDDIDVTFVWQMWHLLQTVRFHDGLHGLSGDICSWCQNMPLPPLPTTESMVLARPVLAQLFRIQNSCHIQLLVLHTQLFHTQLFHIRDSHTPRFHNTTFLHLSQATLTCNSSQTVLFTSHLSHLALSLHIPCSFTHTHISVTPNAFTDNSCTCTSSPGNSSTCTSFTCQIFHTQLFHQQLHTRSCTYKFSTNNSFTHIQPPTTLSHTTLQNNRFCTISFVFPAFPVPLPPPVCKSWKKLTCGVFRSFNFSRENDD